MAMVLHLAKLFLILEIFQNQSEVEYFFVFSRV